MSSTPVSLQLRDHRDWKVVASESFHKLQEFLEFCEIDPAVCGATVHQGFKLRVTRYYASLIEKGNASDPLLLQVLPTASEFLQVPGYQRDAVGDQLSVRVPGLIHKYHGRVLLTLTGACAVNCRYCFRRHFPYNENITGLHMSGPVMSYLSENTDISEVILSGGDPLMASDQKLARLVNCLNQLPHIRTLRVHSRVLSVLPERVTAELIDVLKQFSGKVVIVTHINHPNEISQHNRHTFQTLTRHGFALFNQSVLLKGVNDCWKTLVDLSQKLFESGITPYYLHRLDKVEGAAHFDLPADESCRIYRRMRERLPGYLLPMMVDEIEGQISKIPVEDLRIDKLQDNRT